jgi:hypothetical protein
VIRSVRASCQIEYRGQLAAVGVEIEIGVSQHLGRDCVDSLPDAHRHHAGGELAEFSGLLSSLQDLFEPLQTGFIHIRVDQGLSVLTARIGEDIDQHQNVRAMRGHECHVRFDKGTQHARWRAALRLDARAHVGLERVQNFEQDLLNEVILIGEVIGNDSFAYPGASGNLSQR